MTRRAWLLWLAWFLMLAMAAASLWCADPSVLPADTPVTPARGAIAASPAALEARHWLGCRLGDRDASCEPLERLTRGWFVAVIGGWWWND